MPDKEEIMFQGSLVALVTPMHINGDIDYDALANLIEFQISQGTQGIVIAGTTGEAATLTGSEKHEIIKKTLSVNQGRVPIIAGTGAAGTQQTIELTQAVADLGVDGCLIMAPPYIKPTQSGLYQHYVAIAKAVAIPQILYNVPGRTVCDLLPDTVVQLSTLSNIIAIKEASGDLQRTAAILQHSNDQIDVLSGNDSDTLAILEAGGKGVISVTANVAPELSQAVCDAMQQNDHSRAMQIHNQLLPLHQVMMIETNPIPVKWALHSMGMMSAGIRLPLTVLSAPQQTQVKQALVNAGVQLTR